MGKVSKKVIWRVFFMLLVSVIGYNGPIIYANSWGEEYDLDTFFEDGELTEVENILQDNLQKNTFSFSEYAEQLMNGEKSFSAKDIMGEIVESIKMELSENYNLWLQCFSVAIVAAVFSNFSMFFKNKHVGEMGFYIGYLLLLILLVDSMKNIFQVARNLLGVLELFIKSVVPVYFFVMAGAHGEAVAAGGYETTMLLVSGMELLCIHIMFPAIQIYALFTISNCLLKEDKLSGLITLLEQGIKWSAKGMAGLVLGLNVIQGIMLPATEEVKKNIIIRSGGAIPVVGDTFSGVTETVLSVFRLMQSAVGVAGVVGVLVLCFVPIVKIFVYMVVFRLESALLQPIGEKRMCSCFQGIAKTAELLLWLEGSCILLFCFTILILSFALK